MTTTTTTTYAAFVGLDWADRSHQVCLRAADSERDELSVLPHDPAAIQTWANGLRARFPNGRIAVALEQSRGPLLYALSAQGHLDLYPLNPAMLARYRAAAKTSGSKHDPLDATLICELVRVHRDWLQVLRPMAAPLRELQLLLEARRGWIDQRQALCNQLTALLKSYYPQALTLAGDDLGAPLARAFLCRWPTLASVQRARPATLRAFYHEHGVRSAERIEQRLQLVRQAVALTDDAAVLAVQPLQVRALLAQLEVLHHCLAEHERRIAALFAVQHEAALFAALPGAGQQLAPRLLVAFGDDRTRYRSVQNLQQYSGIAPVREQSGQSCWTRWRWSCPKFLRQTFHEFAGCSIPHSRWAKACYQLLRERGKSHHQALRALAFKWQRVLYRCWQSHQPYDETRYIATLRKRGSPLIARIDALDAQPA